jgi:hypothetical protein
MTPEQRAQLFGRLVRLLDSDQPGERAAALDKIHSLREKMGWPIFGDVLQKLENTVSPEQLEAAEQNAAQWQRAHDDRVRENAALAQRNALLVARVASLRSAMWLTRSWGRVAVAGVVVLLTGWQCSRGAAPPVQQQAVLAPPPDQQKSASADDAARAAIDAALRDLLRRTSWHAGDTVPVVVMANGVAYWVVVRGTIDTRSHTNGQGQPIERHCLTLFATEAVRDAGAFITPSPYVAFGVWMKWPQRAAECRMPGTGNYENAQGHALDLPQAGNYQGRERATKQACKGALRGSPGPPRPSSSSYCADATTGDD